MGQHRDSTDHRRYPRSSRLADTALHGHDLRRLDLGHLDLEDRSIALLGTGVRSAHFRLCSFLDGRVHTKLLTQQPN